MHINQPKGLNKNDEAQIREWCKVTGALQKK
jgi:hypothetical protein